MKFGDLIAEEREFILRSLALCGLRIIVPISKPQGRFIISESELADQDIEQIHLLKTSLYPVRERLIELGFKKKGEVGEWEVYTEPEKVLNAEGFEGVFNVGDLLVINKAIGLGIAAGTKAIVYSKTQDGSVSLLTQKGSTLGLFKQHEQVEIFIFLKNVFIEINYKFTDSNKLLSDFYKGVFKLYFNDNI